MRHPTDGVLRRLVDEPAGVADADREHVVKCQVCRTELTHAHEDSVMVGTALDLELSTDIDAAWQRLSSAVTTEQSPRAAVPKPRRRWRAVPRSPRVATAAVVMLLGGAGAAAAADWFQIFRAERTAPIRLTQEDLVKLPDLNSYGEVDLTEVPQVREVDDAAAVEAQTGLAVPRTGDLPRGVTGDPTFQVGGQVTGTFTFSAEEAKRVAADSGETFPPPPAGLDGSRFRMTAGPGLAMIWSEARGIPAMIVARAVAPTAEASGVPFETARDYLLSLPSLNDDVAAQLRRFPGDGETLPVPVPSEEVKTSRADVGGQRATVLASRDGTMAAVVWVRDGVVNAVAGSLSTDEVIAVARNLRWEG